MTPVDLLLALLLFGLARRKGGGASSSSSTPGAQQNSNTGPFAFPPITPQPANNPIPASVPSGPTFGKQWIVYAPLTPDVVARAKQLLLDPTVPTETIEKDAKGGVVRYLKLTANKKTTVTAWRPNPNFKPAASARNRGGKQRSARA